MSAEESIASTAVWRKLLLILALALLAASGCASSDLRRAEDAKVDMLIADGARNRSPY